MILILLIQVPAIRKTESEPATRIDLDAAQHLNRIVIERVWRRPPTYFVDLTSAIGWKCSLTGKSNPIPARNSSGRSNNTKSPEVLRITIQNVAEVGRHIYVLVQTSIHEQHRAKVADVATAARAALHLIEAEKSSALSRYQR